MGDSLRREVLRIFKILHRTRLRTFEGDDHALQAIEELNRYALEVDHEIRTTVIQAVETAPGRLGNSRDASLNVVDKILTVSKDVLKIIAFLNKW
ncbi:hypothetical protein DMN91_006753 [Ooceraea biroi]|uniref:Uncharacterized protein n=1 Tax=Ooceraea biroi TaxID=2015173 RepID=A0A3L8DIA1_OOCBI|nr:hypothetical protein DMN91_006753 [Ooceraea biroi]